MDNRKLKVTISYPKSGTKGDYITLVHVSNTCKSIVQLQTQIIKQIGLMSLFTCITYRMTIPEARDVPETYSQCPSAP